MRDQEVEVFEVGRDCTVEELKAKAPGAMSVPQIFKDGVLIGGFRELQQSFTVKA